MQIIALPWRSNAKLDSLRCTAVLLMFMVALIPKISLFSLKNTKKLFSKSLWISVREIVNRKLTTVLPSRKWELCDAPAKKKVHLDPEQWFVVDRYPRCVCERNSLRCPKFQEDACWVYWPCIPVYFCLLSVGRFGKDHQEVNLPSKDYAWIFLLYPLGDQRRCWGFQLEELQVSDMP